MQVNSLGKERTKQGRKAKMRIPSPRYCQLSPERLLPERGRIEKMYWVDEMPNETINEENCFLQHMKR